MIDEKQLRALGLTDLTLESAVRTRADALSDWLKEHGDGCDVEQRHLDAGTQERIYWHYGYLMALRDVIAFLDGGDDVFH